jgi:lysozyme
MNRKRLKAQLIYDEGVRASAYQDSEDYWTIGVGRLIDEKKGGKLSADEIEYLLDNDIDKVINQVIREFDWYYDLSEVRKEVILNMAFNLGIGGVKKFKNMINALKRHDWDDASREMLDSKWSGQVGQRAIRLSEAMRTDSWGS